MNRQKLVTGISAAIVLFALIYWLGIRGCGSSEQHTDEDIAYLEPEKEVLFGIEYDTSEIMVEEGVVEPGQSISTIFARFGVSPVVVDRTAKVADSVFKDSSFNLKKIRAGKNYAAFITADSLEQLKYFVYEHSVTDYMLIAFEGDSISVSMQHKDVVERRKMASATITSSLWNSMVAAGMPVTLSEELAEKIFAWSIDFFGLQSGDHFTVIYDERYVDDTSIGVGRVWGAIFNHAGRDYYAIPFEREGKLEYWDELGNSLRKHMLKAPLKYSRISSKFSPSRMHPVLKIRRPHYGVDYAAPSGTPVQAVADGTIIMRGWDSRGGGNTIKIRHSRNLETGYLHLRGFAKGIAVGTRVKQGEIIGYVGSTGTSTGPHLDYRVWQGGKPVDPLKITSEPAEPISTADRPRFEFVKERILAELRGELADSLKLTRLDSLVVTVPAIPVHVAAEINRE